MCAALGTAYRVLGTGYRVLETEYWGPGNDVNPMHIVSLIKENQDKVHKEDEHNALGKIIIFIFLSIQNLHLNKRTSYQANVSGKDRL